MITRTRMFHLAAITAVAVCYLACGTLSAADEQPAAQTPPAAGSDTVFRYPATVAVDVADVVLFAPEAIHLATSTDQLGAEVSQVDDVLRSHLGLGEGKGLVVVSVAGDGPAAKAGMQKNEVLTTIGGKEIVDLKEFRETLKASADKPVSLGFIRAGQKQSLDVTPRATTLPADLELGIVAESKPKYWLGLGLAAADDTLRSQLSLRAGEGLVVTGVENDSPAAQAGVMINDVLLQLDEKALTTIEALSEQLQSIAEKSVSLKLLRRGKPATLTVTAVLHAEPQAMGDWFLPHAILLSPENNSIFVKDVGELEKWAFNVATPNLTGTAGQSSAVEQIREIEERVKQLEASLAALRTTLETSPQTPAPK
jgi:membrane-associated protease RseP (regulator of RpoE activity)